MGRRGRFPAAGVLGYIIAQVLGAVAAGGVLYVIASGQEGFDLAGGNPARSTGVALHVGDWALSELWLFWLAPIAGPWSAHLSTG